MGRRSRHAVESRSTTPRGQPSNRRIVTIAEILPKE